MMFTVALIGIVLSPVVNHNYGLLTMYFNVKDWLFSVSWKSDIAKY